MVVGKIVLIYEVVDGREPLVLWLDSLGKIIRARIKTRIDRLAASGNLGDWKFLDKGLFEMRFSFGAGYRIYYSMPREGFVVLLYGGTKKTQSKDIEIAHSYLKDFKTRSNKKLRTS